MVIQRGDALQRAGDRPSGQPDRGRVCPHKPSVERQQESVIQNSFSFNVMISKYSREPQKLDKRWILKSHDGKRPED